MDTMNMTTMAAPVTVPTMIMMPFHTEVGNDMIWLSIWMPTTVASTFGACVGLFFLAIFYRFTLAFLSVNALRVTPNEPWANEPWAKDLNKLGKQLTGGQAIGYPAFAWKTDLPMGFLEGLSAFVGYLLMLAVMVMNTWFFWSIILGVIVGETSFGRFRRCVRSTKVLAGADCC